MQLTNPELEILKLLWKEQPLTAKEIHTQLSGTVNWSYSSTRKTLERMGEKKLVSISLQENKNIYATKVSKVATLAKFAQDFAKRVLEIDGPIPAAMFTGSQILEKEEVEELEQLLNNAKRKKQSQ
ncbi:BlaI/MecI/CopY family transcriptional regulator [Aliikangiella marina]|uniref:BlaI/MecI/CopY family transcriptional regulator n=1 Tax=Aliikangiella marina TaxID=1712262 RepID=A0A545T1L7_9GAMM|nr:BlaI/MecI/CopY family transcriptional regulator [Aliikangiella marina]TQV71103.1 BlaI/MecI/CopY family transcriptional regulator [Aliikangiella marina]